MTEIAFHFHMIMKRFSNLKLLLVYRCRSNSPPHSSMCFLSGWKATSPHRSQNWAEGCVNKYGGVKVVKLIKGLVKMSILLPQFYLPKQDRRPSKDYKIDKKSCENVHFTTTIVFAERCKRPRKGCKIDNRSCENVNFATTILFAKTILKAQ